MQNEKLLEMEEMTLNHGRKRHFFKAPKLSTTRRKPKNSEGADDEVQDQGKEEEKTFKDRLSKR